jgi:hypothetical protein
MTSLRGPLAWPIADALFDRPAMWAILRLWLPLSRAWAAAAASGGDADRFAAEAPLSGKPPASLHRRLKAFESVQRACAIAEEQWLEAMFAKSAGADLSALDRRRNRLALRLAAQRLRFLDLAWSRRVPMVRFAVPTPAEMARIYGGFLDEPWRAYLPRPMPKIEQSQRLRDRRRDRYWLRFESTSNRIAGLVFARVSETRGVANPPTVIFANGICIESDFEALIPERAAALGRPDLRIVEIESPWHGRRRKPGFYSGEPFLGTAPLGPVDLFSTTARDLAALVDWSRQTSSGRVVLAGASMGSLAVTLAAGHSSHWPQHMRPDGLILLTTVDDIGGLEQVSALTTGVALTPELASAGWTDATLVQWHPLIAPAPTAPLLPENIVMVLGRRDTVLPYRAGLALAERWAIPRENLFTAEGGHFSSQAAALLDRRVAQRVGALFGGKIA